MEIKFTGIGMRVFVAQKDFAASADFYEQTLSLKRTFRDDINRVATYEFGFGPRLVLETFTPEDEPDHEDLAARFTGITLTVKDVEAAYLQLKTQGVPFLGAPEKMYWGGVMAHFKDPGGNTLTLIQMPGARN